MGEPSATGGAREPTTAADISYSATPSNIPDPAASSASSASSAEAATAAAATSSISVVDGDDTGDPETYDGHCNVFECKH